MDRVMLVHGTFDPTPDWCADGSIFKTALEKRLHPRYFQVATLYWTARNSFRSRYAGALRVRKKIQKNASSFDRLFMISHSHGGNVSLKATDTSNLRSVRHVAIGTPFIQVKSQGMDILFAGIFSLLLMAIFTWSISLAGVILSKPLSIVDHFIPDPNGVAGALLLPIAFVLFFAVLIAVAFFILAAFIFIFHLLSDIGKNRRDQSIFNLSNASPSASHILCIYTLMDEAYIALRASSLVLRFFYIVTTAAVIALVLITLLPIFRDFKLAMIEKAFGDFGLASATKPVHACKFCEPEISDLMISLHFFPLAYRLCS